jgi:Nucleoporin autopeptidase
MVLRRHGYYTLPSSEELQRDEKGYWLVDNFVVGRAGYGNVMFYGLTNVEGLNLDEIGGCSVCKHCIYVLFVGCVLIRVLLVMTPAQEGTENV